MADPISIASGLVALAGFALQSSKSLYEVVQSFQSNQRSVRELREELEATEGVLQSLHEAAANTDTDLGVLKLPLLRCGHACKEFEAVIVKCTTHSGGSRTSFRDWAKLRYMGGDIVGFKNMLAGYKATINIALGDVNIRAATVTLNVLKEYKELIKNTTSDLEEHLQEIDSKLQKLTSQGAEISNEDAAERQRMREERDSTQQCLDICSQVSVHIDKAQSTAVENASTPSDIYQATVTALGGSTSARRVTANTLKECRERLALTMAQLERRLQDIDSRLQNFSSQRPMTSDQQALERERIREEIDGVKQCLAICAQAAEQANQGRTNVIEDISTAEDSFQAVVATLGDLISAKRVNSGARATQCVGQMSDASLQQISRDRVHPTIKPKPQTSIPTEVEDQYGPGYKLGPVRFHGVASKPNRDG